MSEREFEIWLNLLGRMLRLSEAQRRQIAAELRDHLDARLDELMEKGYSREDAIETALEEFGDAADLAKQFTDTARLKRRRTLMRATVTTVSALALIVMVTMALMPGGSNSSGISNATAQSDEPADAPSPAPLAEEAAADDDELRLYEQTRARLQTRLPADFDGNRLEDVLEFISAKAEVSMYVDWRELEEGLGIARDAAINLDLNDVSVETLLDLVLRNAAPPNLRPAWGIRDGIIVISADGMADARTRVRMYNVGDLIGAGEFVEESTGADRSSESSGRSRFETRRGSLPPSIVDKESEEPPFYARRQGRPVTLDQAQHIRLTSLIKLITTHTGRPDQWDTNGGSVGSVSNFGTILVVRHTPEVHAQINDLLAELREAQKASAAHTAHIGPPAHTAAPAGEPLMTVTYELSDLVEAIELLRSAGRLPHGLVRTFGDLAQQMARQRDPVARAPDDSGKIIRVTGDGIVTIRHSYAGHRQIEALLAKLRVQLREAEEQGHGEAEQLHGEAPIRGRIYDVRNLIMSPTRPVGSSRRIAVAPDEALKQRLLEAVTTRCGEPGSWQPDGPTRAYIEGHALVIRHTPEVIEQVTALLAELREAKRASASEAGANAADAAGRRFVRVYQVGDLIGGLETEPTDAERRRGFARTLDMRELVAQIKAQTGDPATWQAVGEIRATIPDEGMLAIVHTPEVHAQSHALLETLREAQAAGGGAADGDGGALPPWMSTSTARGTPAMTTRVAWIEVADQPARDKARRW